MRCILDEVRTHLTVTCASHCLGALLAAAIVALGIAVVLSL